MGLQNDVSLPSSPPARPMVSRRTQRGASKTPGMECCLPMCVPLREREREREREIVEVCVVMSAKEIECEREREII